MRGSATKYNIGDRTTGNYKKWSAVRNGSDYWTAFGVSLLLAQERARKRFFLLLLPPTNQSVPRYPNHDLEKWYNFAFVGTVGQWNVGTWYKLYRGSSQRVVRAESSQRKKSRNQQPSHLSCRSHKLQRSPTTTILRLGTLPDSWSG